MKIFLKIYKKLSHKHCNNMRFILLLLEIYIKHILAQYNRPKPSPACTSSLGFSRLYILMLGFIVTQEVIVLYSYTINM